MLTVSLNEDAARTAHLACFHVAQAFIFERTGKSAKSHNGVLTEFFRLTKGNARFDPKLRRFLSQSYEFKAIADYFTGEDATTSSEQASEAVATANSFVHHVIGLLEKPD